MKFSYNLLRQFVKFDQTPAKLAQLLTLHSFEIEKVFAKKYDSKNILTAKVIKIEPHPNANRLRLVHLDIKKQIIKPVVCGASNFQVGDIVALALPKAQILKNIYSPTHEPFILNKATIRGVESQGMICAEFELGLADEPGSGILVLEPNTPIGMPLNEAVSNDDVMLEAVLPANRPDLHSHWGVAREISAILNKTCKEPKKNQIDLPLSNQWKVNVKEPRLCPVYYGVRLSNVKVGPSPKFIQSTLKTIGLRPINNVVDITNFVMFELGQPTHAFDANKIKGDLYVKLAKNGEKFFALNHKEYRLTNETLVISDEEKTLALAAIIGGKDSEVSESTTEVILEVANFNAQNIRNTCKNLNLLTEGSLLWEKGIHPKLAEIGLARVLELLQKYVKVTIAGITKFETKIQKSINIKFNVDKINKLLGTNFKESEVMKYLSRYKIKSQTSKVKGQFFATPPWWRTDLVSMPDLAEEVIKLSGYNKIQPVGLSVMPHDFKETNLTRFLRISKEFWARMNFTEVQNYNFVAEKDIVNFGEDPKSYLKIQNPQSLEQQYLKKNILIPLLKNINLNQPNFEEVRIFEVGKQYQSFENEPIFLAAIFYSKYEALQKLIAVLKGNCLDFCRSLGYERVNFLPKDDLDAQIQIQEQTIGTLGVIKRKVAERFNIDFDLPFLKLEMEKLFALRKDVLFKPINKFPKITREISIVIDKKIKWEEIKRFLDPISDLIVRISISQADYLAVGKSNQEFHRQLKEKGLKNLGIKLVFQAQNRTLTDAEVTSILDKIVLKLKQIKRRN